MAPPPWRHYAQPSRVRRSSRPDDRGQGVSSYIGEIADKLGIADLTDTKLQEIWELVLAKASRLIGLRDDLRQLSAKADFIRRSGAPRWAERIRNEPAADEDPVLPGTWRDAWDYARASGFLARVANRERVQQLTTKLANLVAQRERRFLETIELMTYVGLRQRLTPNIQAALRQFLAALQKLPKTTGAKTAVRQRKILRNSLERAAKAVPCWIMPEWRVAEQLPSELGSFDLVIIDEASQSNILALPVVLRGKKVLVVGDDKQVSPTPIGIEDAEVTRLRNTWLRGQPLADQMDLATSLYELAGTMYPERVVTLREHFRCVEPIIRFSSRFYGNNLRPLRLPKASERIDPPLVDLLVANGLRRGDVNEAEAQAIVGEIQAVVADTALNAGGRRSIGVISLHADKQAKLVYDRLIDTIGPEMVSAHRIMCGDAATFQGQERDIVFLSMVHDRTTVAKQSSRLYEQRYNVALSRARDRMVLVRSVTMSDLKDGDIKKAVLRHFENPLGSGYIPQSDDILDPCQSNFEREFGMRLLNDNYRVRAQVPAGGFSIDFVVEGADDRRLAIELDGDGFHGPERWAADVARQKALERIGWTFWRCWASEWEADKEGVFADLVRCLRQHGIEAIGAEGGSRATLVEFRRIGDADESLGFPAVRPELVKPGDEFRPFMQEQAVSFMASASLLPAAVAESTSPYADLAAPDGKGEASQAQLDLRPASQVIMLPGSRRVRIGDTVRVRFADGRARTLTVQIVPDNHADGRNRIGPRSPLAEAILGLRAEDETEAKIGDAMRTIVVEHIAGPASAE